jgi:hypothetical protein
VFTTNCSRWITERSGQSFEELWLRLCHVRYERLEYPLVGQDPPFEIRFFRIGLIRLASPLRVRFTTVSLALLVMQSPFLGWVTIVRLCRSDLRDRGQARTNPSGKFAIVKRPYERPRSVQRCLPKPRKRH